MSSNNKDDDRIQKSMKQKNSAASNLKTSKKLLYCEMAQMMGKLLRQQAAPEVDIDAFIGDPTEYHYFLAVLEKIDDARSRLTRLIICEDN